MPQDVSEELRTHAILVGRAVKIFKESVLTSDLGQEDRIIDNLDELGRTATMLKEWGARVVLTMGTFDLLHVGHARYIRKARQAGSILIVGVDDDEKARDRKGENRPAVPYTERSELLTHLRYVDIVAKKSVVNTKWEMIKVVRPHVLIAVKGTYSDQEIEDLKQYCGEIVILERQAETSTSAKIRRMILDGADNFKRLLMEKMPVFVAGLYNDMKQGGNK